MLDFLLIVDVFPALPGIVRNIREILWMHGGKYGNMNKFHENNVKRMEY